MTVNPVFTRKAMELYEDIVRPTNFFQSFYKPQAPTDQLKLSYDIVRKLERIAVDVIPGTGPKNIRKLDPFTNKEYIPPEYDEAVEMNALDLKKRMAGVNALTPVQKGAELSRFLATSFSESRQIIERSIELQCVNAFLDGKLTLNNGDVIDFKQKAAHNFTGVDWTSAATDVLGDLQTALDLIRKNGKGQGSIGIFGQEMMEGILSNTKISSRADIRRIDHIDVQMPQLNETGAAFHGVLTVGSYTIELWTYPQSYEDAADATQDYLGSKKAIILDPRLRADLNFGAIYKFANGNAEGTTAAGLPLLNSSPDAFAPYAVMDRYGYNIQAGVVSRPLAIPVAIDKAVVITST